MPSRTVPGLSMDQGLNRYLDQIRQFPMLEVEQEYMLAKRLQAHEDPEAAKALLTSHLRLVAKIAMGYRGYGLPLTDVISEGNLGLMHAIRKFDPEKGFRLATYAVWWIRASIQEFVLRSWSMVKMGTTAAQKKLFFSLRRIKSEISAFEHGDLRPEQVEHIATTLKVTGDDVIEMNRRITGDYSMNAPIGHEDGALEWQDGLADDAPSAEAVLLQNEEQSARHGALHRALAVLNPRERAVFEGRRLREEPITLEELADTYGVSRERIRQIEARAFIKVQQAVMQRTEGLPPAPKTRIRARRPIAPTPAFAGAALEAAA